LNILLPVVIAGIIGITLLILLLRPTPRLIFATADEAIAAWNHRNPFHPATRAMVNPAGTHALIVTESGPGLLWSMGADPVTRLLDMPFRLAEHDKGLVVRMDDVTAPKITIPLHEADLRRNWRTLLEKTT